ncbi:hypothetical protein BPO_1331 [Bergeyella porcorum]|uniref:Uncharacterized protein n=1 Tax=Bergeyella porcorum TaxID=1735111 RepID=A0AAU0F5C2_9FLAO
MLQGISSSASTLRNWQAMWQLKCCLNFELDSYLDTLADFPSSNTTLDTEKGKAFCIKIDVFKKKMWFAYADNPMLGTVLTFRK